MGHSIFVLWVKFVSSKTAPLVCLIVFLTDRGFLALLIGYPLIHSFYVFQLMVSRSRIIITSRNVLWLNKSCKDYMKVPESARSFNIDPIPPDVEFIYNRLVCVCFCKW